MEDDVAGVQQDELEKRTLLQLLSNSLILCHAAPYLTITEILRLGATCRAFRFMVHQTPLVFRRLDLCGLKSAQFAMPGIDHGGQTWRNVQMDEYLTEEDFYSGPLRGIFSSLARRNILSNVQILVLDGLSITAELCHELITNPTGEFNVRILSVREAPQLNHGKLRQALEYACRPSRPPGTPRLKGLYVFGPMDRGEEGANGTEAIGTMAGMSERLNPQGMISMHRGSTVLTHTHPILSTWNPPRSQPGARTSWEMWDGPSTGNWYKTHPVGGVIPGLTLLPSWGKTLAYCAGNIAFDAVLCTSPRHPNSTAYDEYASSEVPSHAVARYALGGCAQCGGAPEGWVEWGAGPEPRRQPDEDRASKHAWEAAIRVGEQPQEREWRIGHFPLLSPVPLHSSNVKAAMCPPGCAANDDRAGSHPGEVHSQRGPKKDDEEAPERPRFIPRCSECLHERYCTRCRRWWCETCFPGSEGNGVDGTNADGAAGGGVDSVSENNTSSTSTRRWGGSTGPVLVVQTPFWTGLCRDRCVAMVPADMRILAGLQQGQAAEGG